MKQETITSKELLRIAKRRSGLSQDTLRKSLHALLGAISESLDNNQRIALDSFGCFELKTVQERIVTPPPPHNMPVVVPTHQVVRFRPYKYILLYHVKY